MRFRVLILLGLLLALLFTGCAQPAKPTSSSAPAAGMQADTPDPRQTPPCALTPVAVPTPPATIPGYAELDPTTNLHVTGEIPKLDFASWRLEVSGAVERPLSLTYDELRCLPKIELECTLVCPGFFTDVATWGGASLEALLEQAGIRASARGLRLYAADGYSTYVALDRVRNTKSFVAYEWEGEPLPILHGFPVRMVFPTLDGNTWVKWLVRIEVVE